MKFRERKDIMKKKICCLCKKEMHEFGNNPYPLKETGSCCNVCNYTKVIPARIKKANELRTKSK